MGRIASALCLLLFSCASVQPSELLQLYLQVDALTHRIEQAKKDEAEGRLTPEEAAAIVTEANDLLVKVQERIKELRKQ